MLSANISGLDSAAWDDLVTLTGVHLTVRGTAAQDTIEVAPGANHRLTINGASRDYAARAVEQVTILAAAGDTVILHDTPGDDTLTAGPGQARLAAAGLAIEASGWETLIVHGGSGGVDVAHLDDSPGDDRFVSRPEMTELAGEGFLIRVESFAYVHGYARRGGDDLAELHGSAGNDLLVGRDSWSRLAGEGYANRAKFFKRVVAYAGGGSGVDHARLYDSSGDDYFYADPTQATLSGDAFSVQAVGFDSVTGYATSGGFDWAELVDSPGDDTLYANPTQAALFGSGYINRAMLFDTVHAYARGGGNDIANLHDSPGDDTYVGNETWGKLYGASYMVRAKFFDSVHAFADSGGNDAAQLAGSPGMDPFVSRESYSRLSGPGYEHRVEGFGAVLAKGSAGDEALLFDSGAADLLEARNNQVQLTEGGAGAVRISAGFGKVTARLSQPGDQAVVPPGGRVDLRIERPAEPVVIQASEYLDASDPTRGFQAAIDALPASGGVVVLPEGTYTLRQGLVLRSGVTLRGADGGTVLTRPNRVEIRLTSAARTGDSAILVDSAKGLKVGDDVAILAYGEPNVAQVRIASIEPGRIVLEQPIATPSLFEPGMTASVVNYFPLIRANWDHQGVHVSGIVIENLVVDGNLDPAVETWRISGPALIQLQNTSDAVIRQTTVRNSPCAGIRLEQGHDNRIENTAVQTVRGHGIYVSGEADTTISAVTVRQAGYATTGSSGDGILVDGSSNVDVENSLVEGSFRYGLHPGGELKRGGVWRNNVSRDNGNNGFHFCWDNFDILVAGNLLEGNGRHGVGGLGLGGLFGDMFNTVSGNLIRNNARCGIEINGGSDNFLIGNTIVDNSQLAIGRFSGIALADAHYVVVSGNRSGSDASPRQRFGIEEFVGANDNLIVDNDVAGNRDGGISVTGATTTVTANAGSVVRA